MIEHNDAYSRAVFLRFKEALAPLMVDIAPDWLLHHIEMERDMDCRDMSERVQIRLVIKPIGEARTIHSNADLLTGSRRIEGKT